MKSNPSSYVLAAEILIIFLFHAVKIRQAEIRPAETALMRVTKTIPLYKKAVENKFGVEYMLVNMLK